MAKRCPKCGTVYPDRDNFCMGCGSGLEKTVKRQGPERPEMPGKLEAAVSSLQGSLKGVRDELGRMSREINSLKSAKPSGDLELLRSAVEDISVRLRGNEKHIEGIEDIAANFARRQEIEELKRGISRDFAQRMAEDNKRVEALETGARSELGAISAGFAKDIKARISSAAGRAAALEARLERLVAGLDRSMAKRMEGFKTGFNEKVNRAILGLREEVSQKTDIINKVKENLAEQIRLNNERYAGFEARMKRELEDIDNFKEGLALQQDVRMKEFQTGFLERLGRVKKLEEDLILQQQKRVLAMEEKLTAGLEGIRQGGQALPGPGGLAGGGGGPDAGRGLGLKREVENAVRRIRRLEEDLVLQQQGKLMAMESRIDKAVRKLGAEGGRNINPKEKRYNSYKDLV